MRSETFTSFPGLSLQANTFKSPKLSFETADNIVFSQDNVIQKRRGFGLFHSPSSRTLKLTFDYLDTLIVVYNANISKLDTSGVATDIAGVTPVFSVVTTPRAAQAAGNAYILNDSGTIKLESLTANSLPAGVPKALDVTATLSGVSGIFKQDSQVGYRVLFGRTDANGLKVIGGVSQFVTISNLLFASNSAALSGANIRITRTAHGLTTGNTIYVKNAVGTGTLPPDGTGYTVTVITANTFDITPIVAPTTITLIDYGVYRTPTLDITLPSGLSTEYFVQVYRSSASLTQLTTPSDDGQLIEERNLTSTEITNKYVTYEDIVDDLFKGAFLYTNANTGQGIALENLPPPLAKDICAFKSCLFWANTRTNHRLSLGIISVASSGSAAIVAGDYIVFDDLVTEQRYIATNSAPTAGFTGTSSAATWNYGYPNASGYHYFYLLNSGGAVTVSEGIAATSQSLVRAVNRNSASHIYAFYTSGPNDFPGQITYQSKGYILPIHTRVSSSVMGACFSKDYPASGDGITSSQDIFKNAIYFSKPDEIEAVPLGYYLFVGSRSDEIFRIIPLRDSIIIVKRDGIFRLSGSAPGDFVITSIDTTVTCKASNSIATLNNEVYCLAEQGVCAISDTSVRVVSRPVENLFTTILGNSALEAQTHAVGYESERLYLLSTLAPTGSTASRVYCYNAITNAWTYWTSVNFNGAVVKESSDVLYLNKTDNTVVKERKLRTKLDFCDTSFTGTCISVSADLKSAQLNILGASIAVGDVIVYDDIIHRVKSVDVTSATPYTFFQALNFIAGNTVTLYKAIRSQIKTSPMHAGDVSNWKQFTMFHIHTRNPAITKCTIGFLTHISSGDTTPTWSTPTVSFGWGVSPWGGFPWGLEEGITLDIGTRAAPIVRIGVPHNSQRSTWLQVTLDHSQAAEDLSIQALVVEARSYSTKVAR